ncbi:hypothetical protein RU97_GL001546 [Enterococcus canis]|uniref:GGDEF domain-containing protein n=1 Tax=Enterococcus canis TaxID=214095 RepID=A0A1L8RGQ0_9ENTE|nr:hypothetical protein [Enterococcus canis]OJG18928.1 hypothetical protein RU97_GL001546 [Enterococcus canis]
MKNLRYKIPLEVGVILLMILVLAHNLLLYHYVDGQTFYYVNVLVLLGIIFGMMGTSLFVVIISMIMMAIGAFILYFYPVVMSPWLKNYLIFIVPVFSLVGYWLKTDIFLRNQLIGNRRDVVAYLKNTDALTQLGSLTAFNETYQRFLTSISLRPSKQRRLAISLFFVDFLDQYRYQSESRTNELLTILADDLTVIRLPEEQLFYVDEGAFVVITPLFNADCIGEIEELNQVTKTQMGLIPFDHDQDITIRSGLLVVESDSQLTPEQVLGKLNRQAETDLAEEYIV